jgi:NADH-quinone oxidoreductase subunit H
MMVGSFNPLDIAKFQLDNGIAFIGPFFLGFLVLLICIVAETERIPFDLPEAESELVEGWTTEYGGMRFGFIMFSEYIRSFVGAGIVSIMFFGGWNTPILNLIPGFDNVLPSMLVMLGKIYMIFFLFIWLRASLPRVRTDQILNFGWKTLLPMTLVNLLIAVGLKTFGVI